MTNTSRDTIAIQSSDGLTHSEQYPKPVLPCRPWLARLQSVPSKSPCQESVTSFGPEKWFASGVTLQRLSQRFLTDKDFPKRAPTVAGATKFRSHSKNTGNFTGARTGDRSLLHLLLFSDDAATLPLSLLQQVTITDRGALIKRNWKSVTEILAGSSCAIPDVLIHLFTDRASSIDCIRDVWDLRICNNYNPHPAYFAISRITQPSLVRHDIECLGGHFLHLFDVPTHFQDEIEQIRLELAPVMHSLPSWLIVQEGNGTTLWANVNLVGRRKSVRVGGSDRLIAALTVFLKHNGIPRSLSGWQRVFADDPLFKPAGGGFEVPSIATLKMYLRRDFHNCLQRAFDAYRSGFCADRVIERIDPGTHGAQYRIRGGWEVIRR